MEHFITYATKANTEVANEFIKRLELVGIKTENYRVTEQCNYYKSVWDDEYVPTVIKKTRSRAGAPLKELTYKGNPVQCGNIYELRERGYSDAKIAEILLSSESTVTRRRKRHEKDGNFYANSRVRF